mmetsp:Transcript_4393/g.15251  ORF Transcript_4393/g.15251 Transcript_4393/m.15251 type:complete len:136 (-) Transcript_4393:135-542(-)
MASRRAAGEAAKSTKGWINKVFFPNIPLRMLVPKEALESPKEFTQVAFKTQPSVSKIQLKLYLEALYGVEVTNVNTKNFVGKKRRYRTRDAYYREPDYKKAWVTLGEPVTLSGGPAGVKKKPATQAGAKEQEAGA